MLRLLLPPSLVLTACLVAMPSATAAPQHVESAQRNDVLRASTLMVTASDVPSSLRLARHRAFKATKAPEAAPVGCEAAHDPGESPQAETMFRARVGGPVATAPKRLLEQSMWVYSSKRSADKAWEALSQESRQCDAHMSDSTIVLDNQGSYRTFTRSGTAIQSLDYTLPSNQDVEPAESRQVRALAKNLATRWEVPVGAEKFYSRSATGGELASAFFTLLTESGSPKGVVGMTKAEIKESKARVRPYLDSAFQLVRANGQRYLADTYIPSDIDEFTIDDVYSTTPADGVMVARYSITAPGQSTPDTGLVLSDKSEPRLTTFHWDEADRRWKLVSHANFSAPIAAICDAQPIDVVDITPETKSADLALGTSLIEYWRDITTGKIKGKVMHPTGQIQLADGQAWPNTSGTPIKWAPAQAYEFEHLDVTRKGELLVASYDAVTENLQMEGQTFGSTSSPRLLTYLRSPEGQWQLIALANFVPPKEIPAGVACVK